MYFQILLVVYRLTRKRDSIYPIHGHGGYGIPLIDTMMDAQVLGLNMIVVLSHGHGGNRLVREYDY